jgi:hypothetical protein
MRETDNLFVREKKFTKSITEEINHRSQIITTLYFEVYYIILNF